MALTGHFLNFRDELDKVRTNMIAEIDGMTNGQPDILCDSGDYTITRKDDEYPIETVFHSPIDDRTHLKSDNGTVFEISELLTDDLVALYEFVFGVLYPDEN
jgi:hypothetical protein